MFKIINLEYQSLGAVDFQNSFFWMILKGYLPEIRIVLFPIGIALQFYGWEHAVGVYSTLRAPWVMNNPLDDSIPF